MITYVNKHSTKWKVEEYSETCLSILWTFLQNDNMSDNTMKYVLVYDDKSDTKKHKKIINKKIYYKMLRKDESIN